jgi:hypothetical protein
MKAILQVKYSGLYFFLTSLSIWALPHTPDKAIALRK